MRLDARDGGEALDYMVFDARNCELLEQVVWVDDHRGEYFQYLRPLQLDPKLNVIGEVVWWRRVRIDTDSKLVTVT